MMAYLLIGLTALLASGLTLFSGFGLGTLLTPAFAVFFPAELAVALTAVVHLANNIFKLFLLGRHADRDTVLRFGLPAAAASFLGARALVWLSGRTPLAVYELAGRPHEVTVVKLVIGALLLAFVALEAAPRFSRLEIPARFLPLGGLLSGFFGGLSGTQGALRSAFLVKSGLSKESFIATGVVLACLIDVMRLSVYWRYFSRSGLVENWPLVGWACAAAFAGAFAGSRFLHKATMGLVRALVAAGLALIGLALAAGLL